MKIRLKDAFNLQMGKTPARNTPSYWDGDHKWISIADIGSAGKYIATTKERITDKAITESGIRPVPAHTVIMSFKLSIGKTAITSEEMYTNEAIMAFISNGTYDIDIDYFYHLCCGIEWTEGTNKAVMGLTLNKATLSEKRISLPEITEQRNIAAKFDALDKVIEKTQAELSSLDQLVKSRFMEMFEKGEFERIPFEAFCEFLRNGASIKQTKGAGGYPITRIETLANDAFNLDRLGYANITELKGFEKYILQKGDILISHINSVAYLGRAVQYRGESNTPIIHGMNLLCARLRHDCNSTYVEYFFKTPMAKDYISTITKKAVNQASITTTDLKKMLIPAPPLELQNRFAAFVAEVDKSKFHMQKLLAISRKLWTVSLFDVIINMD